MLHTRKEQMEAFGRFLDILDELREKCPWDRKQTNESLRPNTIEETYELCDALIRDDKNDICKELGDVLLHVAFYAKIGSEKGDFDMKDVCDHLCEKLIFRHPHVFGDVVAGDANEVLDVWDQIKMAEKESADAAADVPQGLLDGVPKSFPALKQAQKISRKAASAGFEWETVDDVWAKVDEEVAELKAAYAAAPKSANGKVDAAADPAAVAAVELEMGDVLFSLVNVARKMGVQAEEALRATCGKFRARWAFMEGAAAGQGRRVEDLSMEEMEELWQLSKVLEG